MKLLVISHSAVVGGYHDRYREVVRWGGVDLTLLVPKRWRQFNRTVELEKKSDPEYKIVASQPLTWGLPGHGLRNVSHIYPGIGGLIAEVKPGIIEIWEEPFAAVTAHTIRAAAKAAPSAKIIFFSARNLPKQYPPPFSWFQRYTYKRADLAFAMNRDTVDVLRRTGWEKECRIIPLGVDPERFRRMNVSELRAEMGLKGFTVGFVGKLTPQKGILDLIPAWAGIDGDSSLLIIGAGELEKEIRRRIRRTGREDRVKIIPPVPYARLPAYLNCLDLLVLPSLTRPGLMEQFGRVLIEAMACGIPVIGSDSGEIPNVIGEDGLIFREGKIADLREKISRLRDNSSLARRLGAQGRERVLQEYSWAIIARKQREVYAELIGKEKEEI